MLPRSKYDRGLKPVVIIINALAAVGACACLYIILVRVPALSTTKLEELSGTLQGTAMAMLFVITALLVDLIYMVYRAHWPGIVEKGGSA